MFYHDNDIQYVALEPVQDHHPLSGGKRTAVDRLYCQNLQNSNTVLYVYLQHLLDFQFGRIHCEPEKGVPVTRECQYACFFFS